VPEPGERWNHNIHYHRLLLDALPTGTHRVLDVGCGEGQLFRELRARVPTVVGIDSDPASIALARRQDPHNEIDYRCADFLTAPLPPGSFDFVASVATLHHLDPVAALGRMADLLRPGGRLVVVGLARSELPRDLPRELTAVVADRAYRRIRPVWEHPSPTVWPPPHTCAELRRIAEQALPGVAFRRRLLWRYSLAWTRPAPA
jgi:SAM-dependent methyltransferase